VLTSQKAIGTVAVHDIETHRNAQRMSSDARRQPNTHYSLTFFDGINIGEMDEVTSSQAADIAKGADGWEQSRLDGPILNALEGPIAIIFSEQGFGRLFPEHY